jgi:2-(1,2-epoxy-1,2-dihydrophenyl)acetyl-CoA isomerase
MIVTELVEGIATVRLAAPQTANALDPAAFDELARALQALQREDSGARAIVLTGTGRVFSAGANLDALGASDADELAARIQACVLPVHAALAAGRLPTIAAVNGVAVGGAIGLALLCDFVVAARSARFSFAFARLGLIADTGLTATLPRLVGEARARAWLMGAADVDAEAAAAAGMIHRCVPVAALPGGGFAHMRAALERARLATLPDQMAYEAQVQAHRVSSEEFRAALAAFMARRRP